MNGHNQNGRICFQTFMSHSSVINIDQASTRRIDMNTGRILFYPNLAVEEVSNYKFLLNHLYFDYVESYLIDSQIRIKKGSTVDHPPRIAL